MTVPTHQVRAEFDQIALLTEQCGNENDFYYRHLLNKLPPQCVNALEIGCGAGAFTRQLGARAQKVVGIDLSPQMLRLARQRSEQYANIEYISGDFLRLSLPNESYDCIVTIATLHHLPLEQALRRMDSLLKPGGVLLIHDLVADDGLIDMCMSALALPVNFAVRFWKTGRLLVRKELRKAWTEHAKYDVYLTLSEVREMCRQYLPGALVERNLLWRYTVVWHKGGAAEQATEQK